MKLPLKLIALGFAASVLASCASNDSLDTNTTAEVEQAQPTTTTTAVDKGSTSDVPTKPLDPTAGLSNVFYFEFDKSTLTAQTRRNLDAYASALRSSPRNIRLEGHADERGTREYNIALGERRGKSVADYLIASGVSAGRIEVVSYGEERPAVNGSVNSAWQQNRRVELK